MVWVVYHAGKVPMLHVTKLLHRFLDENGPVTSVEMECPMAKVGSVSVGCSASYSISLTT